MFQLTSRAASFINAQLPEGVVVDRHWTLHDIRVERPEAVSFEQMRERERRQSELNWRRETSGDSHFTQLISHI